MMNPARFSSLFLLLLLSFISQAQEKVLKAGMTLSSSVKIKKGDYKLSSVNDQPIVIIKGNNITIDFNNARLIGNSSRQTPDQFSGIAIQVAQGKNIIIKNLTAKGYKVALIAQNIENLTIENCDFSYNYRQHLNSTQEKEDLSDWMSYHHNEKDEWLRYGAAMYLRVCNNAAISNCKVTGGQNALMLMECNTGMVYNNDFSFNSGIGIGLYRSSGNKFLYNKMLFNVRGYSYGVYNRGQDSAGFLVYEQSNNNLFYKNNATHSGDGFFLWAGQSTMDTGLGGCNDNVLWQNDFSYAPTNGIEVTFSRNIIIRNRVFECDHGIWGGYSYNSRISDNRFRNNRIAIAIEHGQENRIHHNLFAGDKEAIKLWARNEQLADWGYAKYRDTRSRNYIIASNSFNENEVVYNISQTDSLKIFGNRYNETEVIFKTDSTVTNIDREEDEKLAIVLSNDTTLDIPMIKTPANPFSNTGKLAGRKNIRLTEWGPYNFEYPIIWNTNPADSSSILQFDLLGPKGKWRIVSVKGVKNVSLQSGTFPAQLSAEKIDAETTDIQLIAEYVGSSFTDPFGNKVTSSKPYRFIFRKFFQPINFTVQWFSFDSSSNPIKDTMQLTRLASTQPFKSEMVNKLDYAWWDGIKENGQQYKQFLTVAEGAAMVPQGTYELGITWDDAVRVYVDGKRLIDEWNPSRYTFDESPNKKVKITLGGRHTFRVEHMELGGFATLNLKLKMLD